MSMPASTWLRTAWSMPRGDDLVERRLVVRLAPVLREQHVDDRLRSGQAAHVRGEDAIVLVFMDVTPSGQCVDPSMRRAPGD